MLKKKKHFFPILQRHIYIYIYIYIYIVPSWFSWVLCHRVLCHRVLCQRLFSWVFREFETFSLFSILLGIRIFSRGCFVNPIFFSRGYLVGLFFFPFRYFVDSNFSRLGIFWIQIFSRGYFVG